MTDGQTDRYNRVGIERKKEKKKEGKGERTRDSILKHRRKPIRLIDTLSYTVTQQTLLFHHGIFTQETAQARPCSAGIRYFER